MLPTALVAMAGVVVFLYLFRSVPLPGDLGAQPSVVLDRDGEELGTLQPEFRREDVALEDLPDHVVEAVLAAEDASFYEHDGVSLAGTVRAAVVNLTQGELRQGGSTITQQYVKNAVLEDTSRTAERKVLEAVLAFKMERQYTKDEILGYYLNGIYFGRGAQGIQAAARAYFGKDAADLAVDQSALLAGVIAAPSSSDPRRDPERAEQRYRYVLGRMVEENLLRPGDAGRLRAEVPATVDQAVANPREAPFFMQLVERQLDEAALDGNVYTGLTVRTTLDSRMQGLAEEAYAEQLAAYRADFAGTDEEAAAAAVSGSFVVLDSEDGTVRALVGGEDYAQDQVNLAEAPRQPGSTFKPFALAAWVEQGWSPQTWFAAPEEIVLDGADGNGRDWRVSNYAGAEYDGGLSLRQATWGSVNTVYAQAAKEVGFDRIADLARRSGVHDDVRPFASLVLGTEEVTPLELAEAYNTLAAGGVHREPSVIDEVSRSGSLVWQPEAGGSRAMPTDVAASVTEVLQGVVQFGTANAADFTLPGVTVPVAGKTGTTQDYGDAWFAGYTPELTGVVWMGNRDNREAMPGEPTGGGVPAEMWAAFMEPAHEGLEIGEFPVAPTDLDVLRLPPPPSCGLDEELVEDDCVPLPSEEPTEELSEASEEATEDVEDVETGEESSIDVEEEPADTDDEVEAPTPEPARDPAPPAAHAEAPRPARAAAPPDPAPQPTSPPASAPTPTPTPSISEEVSVPEPPPPPPSEPSGSP